MMTIDIDLDSPEQLQQQLRDRAGAMEGLSYTLSFLSQGDHSYIHDVSINTEVWEKTLREDALLLQAGAEALRVSLNLRITALTERDELRKNREADGLAHALMQRELQALQQDLAAVREHLAQAQEELVKFQTSGRV